MVYVMNWKCPNFEAFVFVYTDMEGAGVLNISLNHVNFIILPLSDFNADGVTKRLQHGGY
jgi:hypothetical protein